ncbi:hypothetical protein PanWU01x14_252420 [Parasponia andersonii]|uniref:Uncharacterized protein n=1 Tax=Parasponia andersonii TaxID=3476 RepID=A0A2P5BC23_PARAD|nr:hypothetical protein PanWU01x14_252420 [Parasponia andersonii]
MPLLERFREAVFQLIMFSAFSKASDHAGSTDVRRCYHPDNDHRHNEAVADCIEFIKKKALPDDQNRDSSAGVKNNVRVHDPNSICSASKISRCDICGIFIIGKI